MRKRAAIIGAAALIVGVVAALYGVHTMLKARRYVPLEKAAVALSGQSSLGIDKRGSRECYTQNTNTTQCQAVTYTLTRSTCAAILRHLNNDDKAAACGATYLTKQYAGQPYQLYIGSGNTPGSYWLQVWKQ